MKKNHTTLIFIVSILTIILFVALLGFFLKVIKNKNQHTAVILATLQDKISEKENILKFNEKILETEEIQKKINNLFVDPNKIDEFVNYLEKIGEDTNSEVSVIDVKDNKKILSFNLSIRGSFDNVVKSITLLENIPYQTDIVSFTLNEEAEQKTVQANVIFNILSL